MGVISAISSDVITFTDATWAPGIWVGMEGAVVEIFDSALTTKRVSPETAIVTAVDVANKKITIDATPTSTAATDRVFFQTQRGKMGADMTDDIDVVLIRGELGGTNSFSV